MIELTQGNLLKADVEALVNTVNTVGYMGKGIALQFKQAFPANFAAYERACAHNAVKIGRMFVYETDTLYNPRYIINFPTKAHWRGKSQLSYIEQGLVALIDEVKQRNIQSIAIPPLGCGLGGLDWAVVRPLIEQAFAQLPNVHVLLYTPEGAPDAQDMPIGTARQPLTPARAVLIKLIEQYNQLAYRLSLLEIQKLAYFLQEAGEPLRLNCRHPAVESPKTENVSTNTHCCCLATLAKCAVTIIVLHLSLTILILPPNFPKRGSYTHAPTHCSASYAHVDHPWRPRH